MTSFVNIPYDQLSDSQLSEFNSLAYNAALKYKTQLGLVADLVLPTSGGSDALQFKVIRSFSDKIHIVNVTKPQLRIESKTFLLDGSISLSSLSSNYLYFYYPGSQSVIRSLFLSSTLIQSFNNSNVETVAVPENTGTVATVINSGAEGGTVKQKEVIKKESIIGPGIENSVGMRVQSVSTGYKFDFYLAPAMQSNFRMPGGRDVPNALPGGLNIRVRPNISKMKIPGSKPVYQNLGIDSVVVTVVGAFTGGNLTGTFFKENTSRIDDTEPGASLDTYRDYNEFISLIDLGEELDVEINLNQNMYDNINTLNQDLGLQPVSAQLPRERFESAARNMFYGNSEANKRATTFLRLQNGNPQFRCFLRDMQYSFVRDNLSYYIMQFEVTDFSSDSSSQNCVDYKPARLFNFEERTAPTDAQGNVITQRLVNINKTGVVKSVADRDVIFNRLSQKDKDVLTKFFALDFTPDKNSLDWSFVSIGVDKYELVFLGKKDAFYDSLLRTVYGLFIDGNLSNRRLFIDANTISNFMNFSYVFDPASVFTADSLDKYKTDAEISKSQVFDKLSKEQQAIVLKFEQLDGVDSWEFLKTTTGSAFLKYYISYVGTKEYVYESGGANRIVVRTNSQTLSEPKSFVLTQTNISLRNGILYFSF